MDRCNGKQRTFAFVTYSDVSAVAFSCELFNSLKLFNRPIYCKPNRDGKPPIKSHNTDHAPIITSDRPGQPPVNEPALNNSWIGDDRSPQSVRRDYYLGRERHVDHQRNNCDYRNSPPEIRSNSNSSRYDRENDLLFYDHEDNRRMEDHHRSDTLLRSYDESLPYRLDQYERHDRRGLSNQLNPMFFQSVNNSIDQLRRESSFGNSPLRYGPQRDDLIPRHRSSRRQNTQPY